MEEKKTVGGKMREVVLPRGPKTIAEPEKELRFTRAAQAPLYYGVSVVFFAISLALFILSTQDWGMEQPLLHGWWWLGVVGLTLSYFMFRTGLRCTRHAYIILSPLGVEIFSFFNPRKNLQVVYWSQVVDAEIKVGRLILHYNEEKQSGVIVSLRPIPVSRQHLLKEAVVGVLQKREAEVD